MSESLSNDVLFQVLPAVINNDPVWFNSSDEHLKSSLTDVSASILVDAARHLPVPFACKRRARDSAVAALLSHFSHVRAQLCALDDENLFALCMPAAQVHLAPPSRYLVICSYFDVLYGSVVSAALRRPGKLLLDEPKPKTVHTNRTLNRTLATPNSDITHCLNWVDLPAKELIPRVARLNKDQLKNCIRSLPSSLRPGTH